MITGLTREEAARKLSVEGYNEIPASRSKNVLHTAIDVVREPMFLLLLLCGGLYLVLGDYTEGITLLAWIFIIIFISFYQQHKTDKALGALKRLSSPRALVVRDGEETRIAGREIVTDDVVILNEGDRVPADGTIIVNANLTVDESILTGESLPVIKQQQVDAVPKGALVYSGTLVVRG
ncbi:MAG: HAD-IC family P-type ATPase, partial [Saprospiraceae bacterium]|nr:HAD-IC family P-type ATPase [Saprospiraceae bacterium]